MSGDALGPEGFAAATGVSRETLGQLEAYAALLRQWAPRINLVGRATLDDLWRRHFLDSAQLLPLLPGDCLATIDLGSGAGFPGLVLAVLGVRRVELVEADARKCAFLREAARVAGTEVTIHNRRIESVPPHPADLITARACAPLGQLLSWAERFSSPHTRYLLLKGERVGEELTVARDGWTMTALSHPSRTDPGGVVLQLDRVCRAAAHS